MMPTVSCIGIVLNIISIFYFALLHQQRTFHRLLLLLALVDTLHLICSTITFSLPQLSEHFANYTWRYLVPYTLPLAQTSLTASVYLTVSLTCERFFSVVFPLKQFKHRWLRSSFVLSTPGLLFSVLFSLPNYFQLRTVFVPNATTTTSKFWQVCFLRNKKDHNRVV